MVGFLIYCVLSIGQTKILWKHDQLFTYFIQAATAWSGTQSVGLASFSSTASHVELASEHAPVEDDPELWVGPWVAPLWPALASLPISMSPWRISLSELQARAALTLPLQPRQKKTRENSINTSRWKVWKSGWGQVIMWWVKYAQPLTGSNFLR